MAGTKKPNEFPLKSTLDGSEEVYTQTGGISEKFTVEQICDFCSGETLIANDGIILTATGTTVGIGIDIKGGGGLGVDGSGLEISSSGVRTSMIAFGTGVTEVNAEDIPIKDIASNFTGSTVEDALIELYNLSGGTANLGQVLSIGNNTNSNDILMDSGDVLKNSGTTKLDMSFGGDAWYLGNDDGTGLTGLTSFIAGDSGIFAGYQVNSFGLELVSYKTTLGSYDPSSPEAYSNISAGRLSSVTIDSLASPSTPINGTFVIISNLDENRSTYITESQAISINSGTSGNETIFISGVTNSVAIGGQGLTIKTDDAGVANKIIFQKSGVTFDTTLSTQDSATQDNDINIPNASGDMGIINVVFKNVSDTAKNGEVIMATGGGAGITVSLPTPTINFHIKIKKIDAGIGAVVVDAGVATIDGSGSLNLANQYDYLYIISDGTNWFIFSSNI